MISIIVPLLVNAKKDNWIYLEKCVHSIKKNSKENHEILVVTNNGPKIECPIDGVRHIHTEKQGQCVAVNIGVREATHDRVMIIDEDFIFPTNWEELIEKSKEYPFVSGWLMERGGSFLVNNCGDVFSFDEQKFEQDALLLKKEEWETGFGFPLICTKEIWNLVEGYDEDFDPWGSNCDSDLEYKLMLAGIMPMRWKGATFYHFASVSGTFAPENHAYWQRNIRKFEEKWGLIRANSPFIWNCDFKIDGDKLKYKPSWAKLDNPYIYYKNLSLRHIGWVTHNWDLFERFWCNILGFKKVWESTLSPDKTKTLFGVEGETMCKRYDGYGVSIEIHQFANPREDATDFDRRGINHICLNVDDRESFLKIYPFDKRVYHNPEGHDNVFIRDLEGNWIEIYQL